ncbi:MAG: flagellar hook-associated protein FlgL [Succinivibrio sp.]|nr:flagellar hook-associated protein FlgL [Succinivibrio sp.]
MRISTSMTYHKNLKYIQDANSKLDKTAEKYNTGDAFQSAGEDPAGMSAKIKYESAVASYKQYARNASLAADTLSEEETALGSMWTALNSAHTRVIQAVDSTNNADNFDSIAEDLMQLQTQLFDLMNSQNAEGEYIFSGSNSTQQTMTLNSMGHYVCNANGSINSVQVAPNVYVQVSDSGLNIFENCDIAREYTVTDGAENLQYYQVANYDNFNTIFSKYHYTQADGSTMPANANTLTLDVADGKYTLSIYDVQSSGYVTLAEGEVEKDGTIRTQGFEFKLNSADFAGTVTAKLGNWTDDDGDGVYTDETKYKDNILNQLTKIIDTLKDNDLSTQQRAAALATAQETIQLAMDQYDLYRGRVGSRETEIDTVIASDNALSSIKNTAKANLTQADAIATASELASYQQMLSASRTIYSKVQGTSLFDYI